MTQNDEIHVAEEPLDALQRLFLHLGPETKGSWLCVMCQARDKPMTGSCRCGLGSGALLVREKVCTSHVDGRLHVKNPK